MVNAHRRDSSALRWSLANGARIIRDTIAVMATVAKDSTAMDRAERNWKNVELWVTSIHNGQLVYGCHSVHETYSLAMKAAMEEGHAVRTLLVEIKHEGEVL